VLGPEPDLAPDLVAQFVQGGPHGHLVDDIAALAVGVMRNEVFDREDVARIHRILQDNSRLFAAARSASRAGPRSSSS
jgi:hypothetical protein